MSNGGNFTVLEDPNKFVEHILYVRDLLYDSDNSLAYAYILDTKPGHQNYEEKMKFLGQYSHITKVAHLLQELEIDLERYKRSRNDLTSKVK